MSFFELGAVLGNSDDCFAVKNKVDKIRSKMRSRDMTLLEAKDVRGTAP